MEVKEFLAVVENGYFSSLLAFGKSSVLIKRKTRVTPDP